MRKKITVLLAATGLAAARAFTPFHAPEQDPAAPLDYAGLKQMVAGDVADNSKRWQIE